MKTQQLNFQKELKSHQKALMTTKKEETLDLTPVKLTGDRKALLPQLRTKDLVEHALLSLLQVLWKVPTKSKEVP